jgi:hypothetical protein
MRSTKASAIHGIESGRCAALARIVIRIAKPRDPDARALHPEQRTRVAVQALRILPRRGVASVSIGGRIIGRSRPVELRAELERRIVEVIGSTTQPVPFERHDVVRGVDLDRGLVVLGRVERLPCYVYPELIGDVAVAGIGARVRGQLYRPVFGKPFVLASGVDFDERPDDD